MHIREEVFACTRACEHLLNSELTLTPDERNFLEYHLTEVAQHYLVNLPSIEEMQPAFNERAITPRSAVSNRDQ
jgi:hypothetical protein